VFDLHGFESSTWPVVVFVLTRLPPNFACGICKDCATLALTAHRKRDYGEEGWMKTCNLLYESADAY